MLLQPETVTLLYFLIVAATWAAVSDKTATSRKEDDTFGLKSSIVTGHGGKGVKQLLSTIRPVRLSLISKQHSDGASESKHRTTTTTEKPQTRGNSIFDTKLTASVQVLPHEEDDRRRTTTTEFPWWSLLEVHTESRSTTPKPYRFTTERSEEIFIKSAPVFWATRKPTSFMRRPFGPDTRNKHPQPVIKTSLLLPGYAPILATAAPPLHDAYPSPSTLTKVTSLVPKLDKVSPFRQHSPLLASLPPSQLNSYATKTQFNHLAQPTPSKKIIEAFVLSRPTTTAPTTTTATTPETTTTVRAKPEEFAQMDAIANVASTMVADSLSYLVRFMKTVYRQMDAEVRLAAAGVILIPLGLITVFGVLQPQQSAALTTAFLVVPLIGYLMLATSTNRSSRRSKKDGNGSKVKVEASRFFGVPDFELPRLGLEWSLKGLPRVT